MPALAARVEDGDLGEPRPAARRRRRWARRCARCASGSSRSTAATDPWHLKHARGGIVEIEFTVQYLKLLHAARPARAAQPPRRAAIFAALREAGLLPADQAQDLARAYALHQALQAVLRLSLRDRFEPRTAPPQLLEALVRAAALALGRRAAAGDFAGARAAAR